MIDFFEHPEYTELKSDWETYRDLYQNKKSVLVQDKYLYRHMLESGGIAESTFLRSLRETRTTFSNWVEPIISRYTSIFFQKNPDISEVEEMFGDDIKDVDGEGNSLVTFIKEKIVKNNLLYGRPIVLTDSYPIKAKNLEEQEELNLRPFFEIINPLDVKDWEIETSNPARNGQFKWVRCEYQRIEERTTATQKAEVVTYTKIFTFVENGETSGYFVDIYKLDKANDKKGSWVQVGVSDFIPADELPFRAILNSESWIKDTAPLILKLYNLESSRDSIQFNQTYQRTFFIGNISGENLKAISEYTSTVLPEGTTIHTIEPSQTTALDLNIVETRNTIFKVAFNQGKQASQDTKSIESAETQRESKEELTALILSEIETLENFCNKIIKDYAYFKTGKTDYEGKIYFNRDLKHDDVQKHIELWNALRDEINQVPEWRIATLRKMADLQQLPESEELKAIIAVESNSPQQQSIRDTILGELNNNNGNEENNQV